MKLRFIHPASPRVRTPQELLHHLRAEIGSLTGLHPDSAISLSTVTAVDPTPHLTLALDGLSIHPAKFSSIEVTGPHQPGTSIQLESLELVRSQILVQASERNSCPVEVCGTLTHPVIQMLDHEDTTIGGVLTGFHSLTLEFAFTERIDPLLSELIPDLLANRMGIVLRNMDVRTDPDADRLSVFATASVKAFVMNAVGRASASLVRTQGKLFLRDLQAHTDASMLSSLVSGYVRSLADQLDEHPIPISLCDTPLRCTMMEPTPAKGLRARFEAP